MKYLQVLQICLVLFVGVALSVDTEQSADNNEILVLTSNDLLCYQCTNSSKDPECSCEGSKCLVRAQGSKIVTDRRCTDERWVHDLLFDGCLAYNNETWCVCSSSYCNGGDLKSIRGDDDCSANPCPSGSVCLDTVEGYKCMCPPWQKTCTYQAPADCPCQNNGICVRLPSANVACSCPYGFSGQLCQNRDPCAPNPCMNSGSCMVQGAQPQCQCRQGFQGDLCQVCNACSPNPCNNGGQCLSDGMNGFICRCQQGTSGRTCDYQTAPPAPQTPAPYYPTYPPQNPCQPDPCRGRGYGIPFGGQCYCQCNPGSTGQYCEIDLAPPTQPPTRPPVPQTTQVQCRPNPCWNGGQVISQNNGCYCQCPPQYTGQYCNVQTPRPPQFVQTQPPFTFPPPPPTPAPTRPPVPQTTQVQCRPNPCWNGGQVINQNNGCYCQCPPQYTGQYCNVQTAPPPQFVQTQPPFTFPPPPPTPAPTQPTRPQNPCQPNPCYNGGYGIPFGNQCYCQCPPRFTGPNCAQQTTQYVPPPPTLPPVTQTTQVPCRPNWNPCWNGGNQVQIGGNCYCQCPPQYTGPNCNVPTARPPPPPTQQPTQAPCQPNPCYNGGYPIPFGNQCYCQCVPGFTGQYCQAQVTTTTPATTTVRDPCDPNPCRNNGNPINLGGVCVCQCPPGYTGQYCDVVLTTQTPATQPATRPTQAPTQHPCQPNPCQNWGQGVPFGNQCYCVCLPQYTGPNCNIQTQPPTQAPFTFPPPPPTPAPTRPTYYPPQQPTQPVQPFNPCNPNPCGNGGSCFNFGQNQCGCYCPPRYTGQFCDVQTRPPTRPTFPTFAPQTLPPYYPPPQQPQGYNPCQPNPCQNWGQCVPQGVQFQCRCQSEWSGSRCNISKRK